MKLISIPGQGEGEGEGEEEDLAELTDEQIQDTRAEQKMCQLRLEITSIFYICGPECVRDSDHMTAAGDRGRGGADSLK